MSRLYELTGQYLALQRAAEEGVDVSGDLALLEDSLEIKAERIAAVLRNLDAEAESIAAEEKRLAARRKARENSAERLTEYLRINMEAAGITSIRAPKFTLYLTEHSSVVVDDIERVPAEYKRTKAEVSADKKAILAAHKRDGECVEGTRVVTTRSLVIR